MKSGLDILCGENAVLQVRVIRRRALSLNRAMEASVKFVGTGLKS